MRALRLRAGLVGALLLAGACNFSIIGVASPSDGKVDAGSSPTSMPPGSDGSAPVDFATSADLYTPTPDMTPLPGNVGDACAGACGAGLTCMSWVPAGYCSESCDGASNVCPTGSSCVDTGNGSRYCLVNTNGGGNCMRQDLSCRDCGASVCGPSSFCGGC